MLAKCKYCQQEIFDEAWNEYGHQLLDGSWVCYDDDCLIDCIVEKDNAAAELDATQKKLDAVRKALKTIADQGYWSNDIAPHMLVKILDEYTDTARAALAELERA